MTPAAIDRCIAEQAGCAEYIATGGPDAVGAMRGAEDWIMEEAIMRSTTPKPYYEHAGITIYCADCRDILPHLPKVDLVLTDPPYGIGLSNHDTTGRTDRVSIAVSTYHVEGDLSDDVALSVLGWADKLPVVAFASPKNPWPGAWRQWLVWDKGGAVGGGGDVEKCWKYNWELIQVARTPRLNGGRDSSVLRYVIRQNDFNCHPTQKPIRLLKYLAWKATAPTDLILDPFMGSGTTLVAAKQLGRRAIGIEIEEKYCAIAIERLKQEVFDFGPAPEETPEQMSILECEEGY